MLSHFLEVNTKFADWITRRISQYDFIENQDYIKVVRKVGNATAYDYFITLDMAKELCMVENNEKGKEARRYFIQCEKALKKLSFYQLERENIELRRAINRLALKNQKTVDFDGLNQVMQREIGTILINAQKQVYKSIGDVCLIFYNNSKVKQLPMN